MPSVMVKSLKFAGTHPHNILASPLVAIPLCLLTTSYQLITQTSLGMISLLQVWGCVGMT